MEIHYKHVAVHRAIFMQYLAGHHTFGFLRTRGLSEDHFSQSRPTLFDLSSGNIKYNGIYAIRTLDLHLIRYSVNLLHSLPCLHYMLYEPL